ncbi:MULTISPECIES: TRAP transporter large permease [Halanaerobium]|jgi:tripartite ATP-independent transporter DctM subunit|uniref:TRAP transporter, DctM subunit n=1 Tax=Halanaerobium congolense TaxID=54121 RepID=A0A1M7P3A9_9FIRM|nr:MULTISPECIES: TRAP transporter large permease [Halanaerobium]KXS48692.1 MAG: TRAP transporter, DctM subunit [Halanaerobium sp. T82-1]OEG63381.1 MAG: L-dehydroascorbate transporter large permease subunit [Halanaerobium sp. MDAL1]PTX15744.1 tripartite ATP-independent transporter DctM subunit [Halanaerobium congolense]PUU88467.1 MAG: TRAP transporter, DctM subunit [Halanaerobium sp.]PUU89916.1 MAG: TRAP transporter, DctM subunit [Halanaerobium sp.]
MLWLFLGTLFLFVLTGIPVVFALGLSNIALMKAMDLQFMVLPSKMISGMNSFPLLAIPFFMFVGEVMNHGGIAKRLVNFADAIVGHITGGLGHVNILASMFFGGISGSAIADTAAIGGLLIPPMIEQDYPAEYSAAITASSAVIGIIIPPSIPFILYGIITNTSIAQLFMAGIIPGILVGLSLMATTYYTTKKHGYGHIVEAEKVQKFTLSRLWETFKEAVLALTIPFLVVGGILGGVFTATEAGAVAAFVSLILALVVYKEVTVKDLPGILLATAKTTAIVLFLCGMAMVTAWLLTVARVPFELAELLTSLTDSTIGILLITNVLLFLVGFVMDLTPAMLILAPILLPVMRQVGIDPVYFGVIMSINLGIGLITPPVGTVLYVATGVADITLEDLVKSILPFLFTLLAVLALLIAFPQIVMFIPNLMR